MATAGGSRPPRGSARDWLVVLACLVCQTGMGAGGYLFPVFLKPVAEDLGWSRTTYALANPLMSTTVALVGPLVGRLSDSRGPRLVLVTGSLLMSGALFAAGAMRHVVDFYLVAVLIGVAVACLGDLPTAAAITGRFRERRGLALGMVYIGSNLGGAIAPLVATAIAATATWRGALTAMGSSLWLLLLPFALAVPARRMEVDLGNSELARSEDTALSSPSSRQRSPAGGDRGRSGDTTAAARTRDFWLLFWVLFVFYLYRLGVNTHLVAFLSDRGHSDQSAAGSFAVMLALGIGGKLLSGALADRIGIWPAALGNFAMIAFASGLLLVPDLPGAIPVFLVLHGFATAAEDVVVPLVVSRRFGAHHLASVYGLLLLALVPGGAAGPLLAGWVFDTTGSYASVFTIFLTGNLSALLALELIRRRR